jgi:putative PIN family toxin of toxin-antitoxin system
MKIVLDTNCLLRSVPPKSEYNILLSSLQKGSYTLCYSNDILMEYEELLTRLYPVLLTYNVLNFIVNSPYAQRINPFFKWNLIKADPDDNKFVDCALNAGSDYIVTCDRHFNVLNVIDFPPIKVINIEEFKNILLNK